MPDRPHVVLLTVLPKERRARHPYQWAVMCAMIHLGAWQLIFGPIPNAVIRTITAAQQVQLNWYGIIAGVCGLIATWVPERIVHWRLRKPHDFDATWFRLFIELGGHSLLVFVWMTYMIAISRAVGIMSGFSLGSVFALWLGLAAAMRVGQILWTIKRAVLDPPQASGIIGAETVAATLDDNGDD